MTLKSKIDDSLEHFNSLGFDSQNMVLTVVTLALFICQVLFGFALIWFAVGGPNGRAFDKLMLGHFACCIGVLVYLMRKGDKWASSYGRREAYVQWSKTQA